MLRDDDPKGVNGMEIRIVKREKGEEIDKESTKDKNDKRLSKQRSE